MSSTDPSHPDETLRKSNSDYVEEKDFGIADDPVRYLSESHKAYLIERHGKLDLDPIPSMDPADPYNWPSWKVSQQSLPT